MYDELIKALRIYANDETDELRFEAADAIEELRQIAGHYEECAKDYFKDVCYYMERVPKWIPVAERLPEIHTVVLVMDKAHDMAVGSLEKLWDGEVWVCPFADVEDGQCPITHWMPLPEPPKEE